MKPCAVASGCVADLSGGAYTVGIGGSAAYPPPDRVWTRDWWTFAEWDLGVGVIGRRSETSYGNSFYDVRDGERSYAVPENLFALILRLWGNKL